MKLWILAPKAQPTEVADDPWDPWYDKAFGFVIRAETTEEARRIANEHGGDENRRGRTPWLEEKWSVCKELTAEGDAGVILRDFRSA